MSKSKSTLQVLNDVWPALPESHRQFIHAIVEACVGARNGDMAAKDAKRFDRLCKGIPKDGRNLRSMARLLVSLGYLPKGFSIK